MYVTRRQQQQETTTIVNRGLLQLINTRESNINLKHCSGGIYLQHNVEDDEEE